MGVDMYLEWSGMTEGEKKAQYTGFRSVGEDGYIRERYGEPEKATLAFLPESWDADVPLDEPGGVSLDELKARLPAVRAACLRRYPDDPAYAETHYQQFVDFVALARRKRAAGRRVWVVNSY